MSPLKSIYFSFKGTFTKDPQKGNASDWFHTCPLHLRLIQLCFSLTSRHRLCSKSSLRCRCHCLGGRSTQQCRGWSGLVESQRWCNFSWWDRYTTHHPPKAMINFCQSFWITSSFWILLIQLGNDCKTTLKTEVAEADSTRPLSASPKSANPKCGNQKGQKCLGWVSTRNPTNPPPPKFSISRLNHIDINQCLKPPWWQLVSNNFSSWEKTTIHHLFPWNWNQPKYYPHGVFVTFAPQGLQLHPSWFDTPVTLYDPMRLKRLVHVGWLLSGRFRPVKNPMFFWMNFWGGWLNHYGSSKHKGSNCEVVVVVVWGWK